MSDEPNVKPSLFIERSIKTKYFSLLLLCRRWRAQSRGRRCWGPRRLIIGDVICIWCLCFFFLFITVLNDLFRLFFSLLLLFQHQQKKKEIIRKASCFLSSSFTYFSFFFFLLLHPLIVSIIPALSFFIETTNQHTLLVLKNKTT